MRRRQNRTDKSEGAREPLPRTTQESGAREGGPRRGPTGRRAPKSYTEGRFWRGWSTKSRCFFLLPPTIPGFCPSLAVFLWKLGGVRSAGVQKKSLEFSAPSCASPGGSVVSPDGPESPNLFFFGTDRLPHAVKVLPCIVSGDSNVAEQWIIGYFAMGKKDAENIGHIQKTLHLWLRRNVAYPVDKVDDYVKHVFREHNQETDDLANQGTEGHTHITIEGVKNTEEWKATRG